MSVKIVSVKNAFETSAEELKNSGRVFIAHNQEEYAKMTKWQNRFEMWNKLKEKSVTQS